MRLMYDSVDANAIPVDAEVVAGYVDGRFAWSVADWNRFSPQTVRVRISAIGTNVNAHVFDVETGCIWPPENVVPLVVAARKLGIDPTVYVNERNDWAPTRDAFDRAGVAQPHWWVANYNGVLQGGVWVTSVPDGAVGKQFAHPPMIGAHYDLSYVRDFWPGVDDSTEQEGTDDMPNISQTDLDKLLAAADKVTHAFRLTDDERPLNPDVPDDVVGHVMSLRARLEQLIAAVRLINTAVANVETLANKLTVGADGGVVAAGPVDISDTSVVKVREAIADEIEGRQRTRLRANLAQLEADQSGQ